MNWKKIFGLLMILLLSATLVSAAPSGPSTVSPLGSSRFSPSVAANISAYAGNVTEVNFISSTITQSWQGYFGNITGNLVLGTVENKTLYDWTLNSPAGEIYATRTAATPTWTSIRCANLTELDSEETNLGINQAIDVDAVNKTFFNTTSFTTFYVGSVEINQSSQNCYATNLYNETGAQSAFFSEVLLMESGNMIYTALLEKDILGFDNRTHDFQMIVGENGHLGDTSTTPYYFYLELQ